MVIRIKPILLLCLALLLAACASSAPQEQSLQDFLKPYFDGAEVTLVSLKTDTTDRSITAEIVDKNHPPEEAARRMVGVLVRAMEKVEVESRPRTIRVQVKDADGTYVRMSLPEPYISDFLDETLTADEAIQHIVTERIK
jgi:hypothetical protein